VLRHPGALAEQWRGLAGLLESGKLAAPQPQVFPMAQAGEAVASLENRTARGKVVVLVRD
jgi:NADPH2:quinone reductase